MTLKEIKQKEKNHLVTDEKVINTLIDLYSNIPAAELYCDGLKTNNPDSEFNNRPYREFCLNCISSLIGVPESELDVMWKIVDNIDYHTIRAPNGELAMIRSGKNQDFPSENDDDERLFNITKALLLIGRLYCNFMDAPFKSIQKGD